MKISLAGSVTNVIVILLLTSLLVSLGCVEVPVEPIVENETIIAESSNFGLITFDESIIE